MFRLGFRFLGLLVMVSVIAAWLALGADQGWTKTTSTTQKVDEITGIEYPVIEKRFIPGLDFLAAGILGGAFLTGLSFLKKTSTS